MRQVICSCCLLLLAAALSAQTEKRCALVVGNCAYANTSLGQTPLNDARDMAAALTQAGFEVTLRENRRLDELNNDFTDFTRKIRDSGAVGLFYYSGCGLQYEGRNFLIPIGAELTEEYDIDAKCVPVERLTSKMQASAAPLSIVVLDACRAYPLPRSAKELRAGFAEMPSSPKLLLAYAPGIVPDHRDEGGHSRYTDCLLRQLPTPGLGLTEVFKNTLRDFTAQTGGQAPPSAFSGVATDFHFFPALPDSLCVFCPKMVYVAGGRFRMGVSDEDPKAKAHTVTVPDFWIGQYEVSNREFVRFLNDNTRRIAISETQVDISLDGQEIYRLVCGGKDGCEDFTDMILYDNGSQPGGEYTVRAGYEDYATVLVSWYGARAYTDWLSRKSGKTFRLPSEAEWEYAARGGPQSKGFAYAGSNTLSEVGWVKVNSGGQQQFKPGQKNTNELGLYDMSGNVWEWCADTHHDTYEGAPRDGSAWAGGPDEYRVCRGGSWFGSSDKARVACRGYCKTANKDHHTGFRVVRAN